ncbi:MAG: hypothetical protein KGL18_02415 [Burkholderiales bacterium]|nr:hypothetical protein [Burkholderiales bacterium]MDE2158314.1 hypothetical protein [Burkholderiales bacterium]MDE2501821.1 hypothetical protein [Burkholderiales bacterium]
MSNKPWIALALAYAAVCMLVTLAEGPGFHHAPMSTRLDRLLAVPFCWGLMVHGLRFGSVRGRFSTVERDASPITYWINIAALFLAGAFFLWWGCSGRTAH